MNQLKVFLIGLIAIWCCLMGVAIADPECEKDGAVRDPEDSDPECEKDGPVRDPEDCKKILLCYNGTLVDMGQCQPNLAYNVDTGECDWLKNVKDCGDNN